jgi:hypothetical protein
MKRRRFTQTAPLEERLEEQAKRLRQEARGTPPGIERDKLIRRARQAETAAQINQWVSTKGLNAPIWEPTDAGLPRVLRWGPDGHVQKRVDLRCNDENEAIEVTKKLVDGLDVELWQLDRQIRTFKAPVTGLAR